MTECTSKMKIATRRGRAPGPREQNLRQRAEGLTGRIPVSPMWRSAVVVVDRREQWRQRVGGVVSRVTQEGQVKGSFDGLQEGEV